MGNLIEKAKGIFKFQKKIRILIIGPEGSGKKSFVQNLLSKEQNNYEESRILLDLLVFKYNNITLTLINSELNKKMKMIIEYFIHESEAIIFMVDSSDLEKFECAIEDFQFIVEKNQKNHSPILIYANKEDVRKISLEEISQKLELEKIKGEFLLQNCSVKNQSGLFEGFDWLKSKIY